MLKKAFSVFLALSLSLCAGCSFSEPAPSSLPSDSTPPIPSSMGEGDQNANISYYPSEMEGNQPVLTWVLMNQERIRLNEDTILAFNTALQETGCGYQVQLVAVSGAVPDLMEGEKKTIEEADLITSFDAADALIREDALLPLNDWIETGEGAFLKDVLVWDKDWLRASRDGVIYGIPTMTMYARGPAWLVSSEVIAKYGMTEADFHNEIWSLGDVFQAVYEKTGNNAFLSYSPGSASIGATKENTCQFPALLSYLPDHYELLTSTVGIDWREEGAPLLSLYESEFMEKTVAAWQEYYQKGYLYKQNLQPERTPLITPTVSYSQISVQMEDDGSYIIPSGNTYIGIESLTAPFLAVSRQAPHQDLAFDFIKRVFSDQKLYNLLVFGMEGKNYTLENGVYTRSGETPYDANYLLYGYEFAPFAIRENHFLSPARDGLTVKEAHRKDLEEAVFTPYAGITWDFSKVEQERQATEELLRQYAEKFSEHLENGTALQQLETFQAELKNAGIDTLVEELNRQAQEWKEAHPS